MWLVVFVATLLAGGVALPAQSAPTGPPEPPAISVVGNRADLISGGDALVDIDLADPGQLDHLRVKVNGDDVSDAFALRPNGRIQGTLTGLVLGDNELVARTQGSAARLTITNHPIEGPVFSGSAHRAVVLRRRHPQRHLQPRAVLRAALHAHRRQRSGALRPGRPAR